MGHWQGTEGGGHRVRQVRWLQLLGWVRLEVEIPHCLVHTLSLDALGWTEAGITLVLLVRGGWKILQGLDPHHGPQHLTLHGQQHLYQRGLVQEPQGPPPLQHYHHPLAHLNRDPKEMWINN